MKEFLLAKVFQALPKDDIASIQEALRGLFVLAEGGLFNVDLVLLASHYKAEKTLKFLLREGGLHIKPTTLVNAVKGDTQALGMLLQHGDVECDLLGPALIAAAQNGDSDAIQMLLNHKADPNHMGSVDGYGRPRTVLMYAAEKNSKQSVSTLLRGGADPNRKDGNQQTALMYNVMENHSRADTGAPECIDDLVGAGANIDDVDKDGETALMKAAKREECSRWKYTADATEKLLRAGASVNVVNKGGDTALMLATDKSIPVLLHHGANIHMKNTKTGETALMIAAGNEVNVAPLLQAGANVDDVDVHGQTALHKAAAVYDEQGENILNLLEAGASVDATDKKGKTALMIVASIETDREGGWEEDEIIKSLSHLVTKGKADINKQSSEGRTSLMMTNNTAVAKFLVDHGADVNLKDEQGATALMHAGGMGRIGIVKMLLDAGADVDAQDDDGDTALMHTVDKVGYYVGCIECATILVTTGHARVDILNGVNESVIALVTRKATDANFPNDTLREKNSKCLVMILETMSSITNKRKRT